MTENCAKYRWSKDLYQRVVSIAQSYVHCREGGKNPTTSQKIGFSYCPPLTALIHTVIVQNCSVFKSCILKRQCLAKVEKLVLNENCKWMFCVTSIFFLFLFFFLWVVECSFPDHDCSVSSSLWLRWEGGGVRWVVEQCTKETLEVFFSSFPWAQSIFSCRCQLGYHNALIVILSGVCTRLGRCVTTHLVS